MDVGQCDKLRALDLAYNATIYVSVHPYYPFKTQQDCPQMSFQVEAAPSDCSWNLQNSSVTDYLTDIYMVNNQVGYAVGTYWHPQTTDGGANWTSLYSIGSFESWAAVHFIDENTWLGFWDGRRHLENGGWRANWTPVHQYEQLYSRPRLSNANTGWAVGENGLILKTTNGGVSWETQNSPTFELLNAVSFVDESYGWPSVSPVR